MSVFVDTSAIIAIMDTDDPRHENASKTWRSIIESDEAVITSNYVVLETFSLLHSRFGSAAARNFADNMVPAMDISWVDKPTHDTATSVACSSTGKSGPSLVDCVSFEIVRRFAVDRVFAYDRHFRSRGFRLVG